MAGNSGHHSNNVYAALTLCHGVYVAEFDHLKGPTVLLDRPKSFDNARLRQIMGSLPRQSNSGFFVPSVSSSGGTGVAGSVFETQNRLMETADRIARRLLAGSVGDSGDFLEPVQEEDAQGGLSQQEGGAVAAGDGDGVEWNKQQKAPFIPIDDDSRDKRHCFFSSFLDAVPVSRRTGHATFVDNQLQTAATFINNSSFAISSSPTTAGGGGAHPALSPSGSSGGGTVSSSSIDTRVSNSGGHSISGSSSSHRAKTTMRVYVQNDAGLECCVVCACTFALPDVFARGFRRDATIFAICPRVGWGAISPRVCEALRVFGTRMCDNALAVFFADLGRVARAVSKVHRLLTLQHRVRLWEDEKDKEDEAERKRLPEEGREQQQQKKKQQDGENTTEETTTITEQHQQQHQQQEENIEQQQQPSRQPILPKLEKGQAQQEHFKRRRIAEEYQSLAALGKKLRVFQETDEQPQEQQSAAGGLPKDVESIDVASLNAEMMAQYQSAVTKEEEKEAGSCRSRGQEPLRPLADLCPVVWEEDSPTTTNLALLPPVVVRAALAHSAGDGNEAPPLGKAQKEDTEEYTADAAVAAEEEQDEEMNASHHQQERQFRRYARPSVSQLEPYAVHACGPRHWEAAQVLLSRFAPIFMPPIPGVAGHCGANSFVASGGGVPPSMLAGAAAAAASGGGGNATIGSSVSISSLSTTGATVDQQSMMMMGIGSANSAAGMLTPHAAANAPTAPSTITFQFNGKVHETRWGLRGFLFMAVPEGGPSAEGASSSSYKMGITATACIHDSSFAAPVSDYSSAVLHFQPLLPSIFLRPQEAFPRIISVPLSAQQQRQRQQQSSTATNATTKSPQPQDPASRKKIQERTVLPFFTDVPGQFYRKYKGAVENTLPPAARECVLPTVALFPSFAAGRY